MKYLIICDLDDTLLNKHHRLSKDTIDYIKKIKDNHYFILASSRTIDSILPYYNELELNTPIICNNGAVIYKHDDKNLVEIRNSLNIYDIKKIFKQFKEHMINCFFQDSSDVYIYKIDPKYNFFFHINSNTEFIQTDFSIDDFSMPSNIFFFIETSQKDVFYSFVTRNYPNIKLIFLGNDLKMAIYELRTSESTKGNALKRLSEFLEINLDCSIGFGDGNNDLEMLYIVKYGFLMKNSALYKNDLLRTEFNNNEDGVIKELKKLL